jgi:hypothetical protein
MFLEQKITFNLRFYFSIVQRGYKLEIKVPYELKKGNDICNMLV